MPKPTGPYDYDLDDNGLPVSSEVEEELEEEEEEDEERGGEEEEEEEKGGGPGRRGRRTKEKTHSPKLSNRAHWWRTLGLYCVRGQYDKPYLIIEARPRINSKAPGAVVMRISAIGEIAQLVACPMYMYNMEVSEKPDQPDGLHHGLFYATHLRGPPMLSRDIFGTAMAAARKKAKGGGGEVESDVQVDDEESAHERAETLDTTPIPQAHAATRLTAQTLKEPMWKLMIDSLVRRTGLFAPGKVTRPWKPSWQDPSYSLRVRVVESYDEDLLGFWLREPSMWDPYFTTEEADKVRASFGSPHYLRLTSDQASQRWQRFTAKFGLERGYVKAFEAQKTLGGLVLYTTPSTNTRVTLADFIADNRTAKVAVHAAKVPIEVFISALERDARLLEAPEGRLILQARPWIIHQLLPPNLSVSGTEGAEFGRALPLTLATSRDEAELMAGMLAHNCTHPTTKAPFQASTMYGLLKRIDKERVESRGGILNSLDVRPGAARTKLALDLAVCICDDQSASAMERTGSSASVVNLERRMPEIIQWLYGAPPRYDTDSEERPPTAEELRDLLINKHALKLYKTTSGDALARIYDQTHAINENKLVRQVTKRALLPQDAPGGLQMQLIPLAPLMSGSREQLISLATLLQALPLANTAIVTPYNTRRRTLALAASMGLLEPKPRVQDVAQLRASVISSSRMDLSDRKMLMRVRVLVVDAAHLFTPRQLQAIWDTFVPEPPVPSVGVTHIFLMGAPEVMALPRRTSIVTPLEIPGAPFRDLVQTLLPLKSKAPPGLFAEIETAGLGRDLGKTHHSSVPILLLGAIAWKTHRGKPVLSLHGTERPSERARNSASCVLYKELVPAHDAKRMQFADAARTPLIETNAVHLDFVDDTQLASQRLSTRLEGQGAAVMGVDLDVVYELSWENLLKMPDTELLVVLSHGYEVAVFSDTQAPAWKRAKIPMPATLQELTSVLKAHYDANKGLSIGRHTAWELFGRDGYVKSKLQL